MDMVQVARQVHQNMGMLRKGMGHRRRAQVTGTPTQVLQARDMVAQVTTRTEYPIAITEKPPGRPGRLRSSRIG